MPRCPRSWRRFGFSSGGGQGQQFGGQCLDLALDRCRVQGLVRLNEAMARTRGDVLALQEGVDHLLDRPCDRDDEQHHPDWRSRPRMGDEQPPDMLRTDQRLNRRPSAGYLPRVSIIP